MGASGDQRLSANQPNVKWWNRLSHGGKAPHRLAGVGGFELSDPEKPPLEHGLTATEGRSARHIHCRLDWTGVQVTLWQLSREKSLIAKRSEKKGNSGHTSKANFGSYICEFESYQRQRSRTGWNLKAA
jgi:hypothetical protein